MSLLKNPNFLVGLVIVAAIAAGVVGWIAWQGGQAADSGSQRLFARVHDGDGGTTDIPLYVDGESTVQSSLGRNDLEVSDGAIHVESATCANKDCVHQGEISRPGQQIICLPNKMWIEVVHEGDADGQMDTSKTPTGEDGTSSLDATAR